MSYSWYSCSRCAPFCYANSTRSRFRTFSQTGRAQSKSPRLGPKIALRAMKTCSDRNGAQCGPTQLREIDQVTARPQPQRARPHRPQKPARARPRLAQRACGAVRARCALTRSAPTESAMGLQCVQERYCLLWESLPRVQEDVSCPCPALHAGRAGSPFTMGSEAGADLCVVIEWRREGNESRWGPEGEKGRDTA